MQALVCAYVVFYCGGKAVRASQDLAEWVENSCTGATVCLKTVFVPNRLLFLVRRFGLTHFRSGCNSVHISRKGY